jgi:hypothetical protein
MKSRSSLSWHSPKISRLICVRSAESAHGGLYDPCIFVKAWIQVNSWRWGDIYDNLRGTRNNYTRCSSVGQDSKGTIVDVTRVYPVISDVAASYPAPTVELFPRFCPLFILPPRKGLLFISIQSFSADVHFESARNPCGISSLLYCKNIIKKKSCCWY